MSRHAEVEWHAQHSAPRHVPSWTKASTCTRPAKRVDLRAWLALVVAVVGFIVLASR